MTRRQKIAILNQAEAHVYENIKNLTEQAKKHKNSGNTPEGMKSAMTMSKYANILNQGNEALKTIYNMRFLLTEKEGDK